MVENIGKVYLVGAGPGDIGLMTIKGLSCLKKAEVVVYDFHLNAQVLNYINHSAEFIYAGKRGGHHTMTQEEINDILIKRAGKGRIVCRLKGGDPFVFGRGGEEASALAKAGIPFEVVPGVSSAIAAPAYAGIPLTHRHYSSSFTVIPGYEDITKEKSSIDWSGLKGIGTLVFLMAIKNIADLTRKLIENGLSPDTPTAIIRWGTRAEQKTIVGTLGNIVALVKEKDILPPAVMVVGDVVRLRSTLNWYEKKPFFGQRILVTRETVEGFEALEELGAEVISFPTIEIQPPVSYDELDSVIEGIDSYDWAIFTSSNGVEFFFRRFFELGKDIRNLKGIKVCAVGSKTASSIRKFGINVDLMPLEFHAEGLIESFKRLYEKEGLKGLRIVLPRAELGSDVFPDAIRNLGGHIDVPVAYRTVKPKGTGKRLRRFLKEGRITIATFTSPSTFNNFMDLMGKDASPLLRGVRIAVIGPVTKKAIEKAGLKVDIMPHEATIEALVEEIKSVL
ncbi:MAG: uroporphyrinogen-III C-methyltransferase [Nitrospirae bacterium]|nr:uroporphyrinogen-III C-methyltransferase [Nitrospirota bacterium]